MMNCRKCREDFSVPESYPALFILCPQCRRIQAVEKPKPRVSVSTPAFSPAPVYSPSPASVPSASSGSSVCDVCNAPTDFMSGTRFSPSRFKTIVKNGFEPTEGPIMLAMLFGARKQVIDHWTHTIVNISTTDWLLCPSCSQKAKEYDDGN